MDVVSHSGTMGAVHPRLACLLTRGGKGGRAHRGRETAETNAAQ